MNKEPWDGRGTARDVLLETCYTLLVQHEDYEKWNDCTRKHTFIFRRPPAASLPVSFPIPPSSFIISFGPLIAQLPSSLSRLSPSLSLSPRSLPTSLSLSRSRKVKPRRRLMDENGIKMKAHFQIMKICSRRLGSSGGCGGADQINIEIYVCLARAQTIPMCYFQQGAKVENITEILMAFEEGTGEAGPFISASSVSLFDVGNAKRERTMQLFRGGGGGIVLENMKTRTAAGLFVACLEIQYKVLGAVRGRGRGECAVA